MLISNRHYHNWFSIGAKFKDFGTNQGLPQLSSNATYRMNAQIGA